MFAGPEAMLTVGSKRPRIDQEPKRLQSKNCMTVRYTVYMNIHSLRFKYKKLSYPKGVV